MFDFEKLMVYKKAKHFNSDIRSYIRSTKLDPSTKDQLRRASFSIVLNLAEGSSRFSKADRRHFFVIARGSVFECASILDVLHEEGIVSEDFFIPHYSDAEELSKIIFAMIRNLEK